MPDQEYEYLVVTILLTPDRGGLAAQMNKWAAEGWRVVQILQDNQYNARLILERRI